MKKLGIIGAMAVEVELLKSQVKNLFVEEKAEMQFYCGELNSLPVVIVQCGVGKVNASICTQILCDCYGVTHIVNTGVAGSLKAELDIGDLVVSLDAVHHDMDVTYLGYAVGQVPGLDVLSFPADKMLIAAACEAAESVNPGHCSVGTVASGDQFVASKEKKEQILANTNASCTEMEGASIAHTAWRNQVPFVIIRAISDKADNSAQMDYPVFEAMAAKRCAEVVLKLTEKLR